MQAAITDMKSAGNRRYLNILSINALRLAGLPSIPPPRALATLTRTPPTLRSASRQRHRRLDRHASRTRGEAGTLGHGRAGSTHNAAQPFGRLLTNDIANLAVFLLSDGGPMPAPDRPGAVGDQGEPVRACLGVARACSPCPLAVQKPAYDRAALAPGRRISASAPSTAATRPNTPTISWRSGSTAGALSASTSARPPSPARSAGRAGSTQG